MGGTCVYAGRPLRPKRATLERAANGDNRTEAAEQHCMTAAGDVSPFPTPGRATCRAARERAPNCSLIPFELGTYTTVVRATMNDSGIPGALERM